MEAIRTIKRVMNNRVQVELPGNYENQQVEIIILPYLKTSKKQFSSFLLEGPVWSGKEIKHFENTLHKGYQNWKITEY